MSVGALRNVTSSVAPIAALNNNLLPLWLIILGATMLRGSADRAHDWMQQVSDEQYQR